MWRKRVTTTVETGTGRNINFHDNFTWADMNRRSFISQIKQWNYNNYHIRVINDIETPVSNPDSTKDNNLW